MLGLYSVVVTAFPVPEQRAEVIATIRSDTVLSLMIIPSWCALNSVRGAD
jgi:hypothetical protein